jgi:hypothetical protein
MCAPRELRVYDLGAADTSTSMLYSLSGGTCQAFGAPPSGATLHHLGTEHPPSDFVSGTNKVWSATPRLAPAGWQGDDGVRDVADFEDTKFNVDCFFFPLGDGSDHCVNVTLPSGGFDDASCTHPLFLAGSTCDPNSSVAHTYGLDTSAHCTAGSTLYKLGDALTGTYYVQAGGSCMASSPPPLGLSTGLYRSTEAAPDEVLAVTRTTDTSDSGRLKPVDRTSADGACFFYGWYDSQLDSPCTFGLAADGAMRCLPSGEFGSVIDLFSDSACTTVARYLGLWSCEADKVGKFAIDATKVGCDDHSRVFAVMPQAIAVKQMPTLYYKGSDGVCVGYSPGYETYFALGAELEPSKMISAEVTVE